MSFAGQDEPSTIPRATVVGNGGMGTLCAQLLAERGTRVCLWCRSAERSEAIEADRENRQYLPGVTLVATVRATSDPADAFGDDPALIVCAIPCQFIRETWSRIAAHIPRTVPVVSVAKGIEVETLLTPTQVLRDCSDIGAVACLSGPCIAPEAARHMPTSVVIAAHDEQLASRIQQGMSTASFRAYTSRDLLGVELAGAAKNVIAIAAGICDGLQLGDNAKAALVTRGLVELSRLGVAMGADADTFRGLAGMGDLVTTCISPVGRNRSAGEKIGQGTSVQDVVSGTKSVIEGIATTRSVLALARRNDVTMPIVEAVESVLFHSVPPREAIHSLMTRPLKRESAW